MVPLGLMIMTLGLFVAALGILWAVNGIWPLPFGEPFDLLVMGLVTAFGGYMMFARHRRRQSRVYLFGLPELDSFPDEPSRDAAIRRLHADLAGASSGHAIWSFLLMISAMVAIYVGFRAEFSRYVPPFYAKLVGWLLSVGLIMGLLWRSYRRSAPGILRARLLESGVPICVACGYLLRGLSGDRCPECGRAVDEQVRRLLQREKNSR